MGELLDEVPRREAKSGKGKSSEPGNTTFSRAKVARAAGISPAQQVTATRVHRVPRDSFEQRVARAEAFAAALARDLERCVLANAVMARELAVA